MDSHGQASFTCQTLPPWEVVVAQFRTKDDFDGWFYRITGTNAEDGNDYTSIHEWMETAQKGDIIHLDDKLLPVEYDLADIMIQRTD